MPSVAVTVPSVGESISEGILSRWHKPDGSLVRLLPRLASGSLAHFELAAGATSHAVTHRTVEELVQAHRSQQGHA